MLSRLEKFKHLFDFLSKNATSNNKEKNLFSLGARGHYENPITDLLAFFIDPNECHNLNDMVLNAFLSSLELKFESNIIRKITREVLTENRNRIDLIIEFEENVIVIENKIYSGINNPFDDYNKFINKSYPNKKLHFILLSIDGCRVIGWETLSYGKFISYINFTDVDFSNNKWLFF